MFKVFKKIIIALILVVTLFEFSVNTNISYGMTEDEAINGVTNLAGGIVSILLWKQRITVAAIALGLNVITQNLVKSYGFKDGDTSNFVTQNTITPFNIFFNKYNLLDINFFDIDGSGNSDIQKIRESVAKWYHTMQIISAAVSLVVLIYVGIRMAISTVAEEQAKYKKMLVDWAMSVLLLFIMHFIIIFIIYLNDTLVSALEIALTSIENGSPQGDAIQNLITNLAIMSVLSIGITSITALIVFVLIVFQTIMFLVAYIIRMVKVAFLLIIAPLITITYPLDRMGDGQAQAFNNWLKEFIFTVLIQPFHCIIYYAFAGVALNIMIESYNSIFDMNVLANGVLAVMCIKFIGDGEKIVKHIFHFGEPKDGALATGAAITLAALSNVQKFGESARIGTNNMKNAFANLRTDSSAKLNQIQGILNNSDSKVAKGIAKGMNNVGNATSRGMSAIKDNSVVQGISGAIGNRYDKISRTIRGVKQEHINLKRKIASSGKIGEWVVKKNSLSHSLGNMAIMAQLAAGNDFGTAALTGKSFEKAAGNFFPTSTGNIANAQSDNLYRLEQDEYNQLTADVENARRAIDDAEESLEAHGIHTDEEYGVHEDRASQLQEEADDLRKQAEETFSETDSIRFTELSKKDNRSKEEQEELNELARKKAESDAEIEEAEELEREAALEEEKATLIKRRNKALERYALLANRKESFFTESAIKKRMQIRRSGASKKELKSAGDEVLRIIIEAKLMRKKGPESMSHSETIDEDTLEQASASREFIMNTLALAAKKHSNVDMDELISRATDLDPSDGVYEELKEQMEKYLTELRKDEVASAWRDSSKFGATAGNMDDEMTESILAGLQNGKLRQDNS